MAKTVLIVDDDLAFAEMAGNLLEDHGLAWFIARDAGEAQKRLQSQIPDAILLDLGMPDMDGTQLLHWLKTNPQTKFIPVVVCTISRDVAIREHVLELGASDFIHKTAYLRELAPRLEKILIPSPPHEV